MIEMLLAISIVSVIAIAVYTTFSQGMKLWQRSLREQPDLDVELFLEKATVDLRNAFAYGQAGFSGTESSLEFIRVDAKDVTLRDGKAFRAAVPVRVRYSIKRENAVSGKGGRGDGSFASKAQTVAGDNLYDRKCVSRTEESYQKILEPKTEGGVREGRIAAGLRTCSFQYYVWDDHRKVREWRRKWSGPGCPEAVKITIGSGRAVEKKITKIISILPGRELR